MSSYLWDVTAQLDRLILQLRGLGLEVGTLQAIHVFSEQILLLTANRLSIIRASVEHGTSHGAQLQQRLYGPTTSYLHMPEA